VKKLIELQADPNVEIDGGLSPLISACQNLGRTTVSGEAC